MAHFLRKTPVRLVLLLTAGTGAGILTSRLSSNNSRLKSPNSSPVSVTSSGNIQADVLIVGSGAAALTAALRVKAAGFTPLIIEKSAKIGGTSAYSGGGLWIPNTHLQAAVTGHNDSQDEAMTYLEGIIGDVGPASSKERKAAFLKNGPKMIQFLVDQGMKWVPTLGYPDYFPASPGGKTSGRTVEPGMFDANLLGPWKEKLNYNPVRPPFPVYSYELSKLVRAQVSWEGRFTAVKVFGLRQWPQQTFLGRAPCTLGVSMISQLLYLNIQQEVPIWTETPLKELVTEDGRVTGAIIERKGKQVTVEASRGIILAAGGFARNEAMRKKYQSSPITTDWTSASPTDEGDAITAALKIGAATSLMDSAWWGASMVDPASGTRFWCLYDRVLPHSIIVDQSGKRFANESQNYNSIGTALWNRHKTSPAIPAFLILDTQHRERYVLAGKFMPGKTPQDAIDSGFLTKGETIEELAKQLRVNASNLEQTVQRFNGFAKNGKDQDFGRGDSPYDAFLGDPTHIPNANLGTIEKGPFYAVRIWPGDLGTKGGVLTDEYARALKDTSGGKLQIIEGLYVVGNSSATIMGRTYAGAGATLGPALTFAFIAANHIVNKVS
jgi:succinate dehydrogenase/fumarate reductase flavoprotein subunit